MPLSQFGAKDTLHSNLGLVLVPRPCPKRQIHLDDHEMVSRQALRLRNATKFLKFYEMARVSPQDIKRALDAVETQVKERRR